MQAERHNADKHSCFSIQLIDGFTNKGFARVVITVIIIYGSTHAKKMVVGSMYFFLAV